MTGLTKQLGRTALIFVSLIQILVTPLVLILPIILLVTGETAGGRMVGGSAACLLIGLLTAWLMFFRRTRILGTGLSATLLILSAVLWLLAVDIAPDHKNASSGRSRLVSIPVRSFKSSLANVVPEIDQLKLGTYLLPHSDPYIDSVKGARMQAAFLNVYREMRNDSEFVDVGSALGWCYEDLFLGIRKSYHRYEYFPPGNEGEKLPVILFLHGSLGNFKGYTWVLKSLADRHGIAIIAPTFGAGNWYLEGGSESVENAYRSCLQDPRIDPKKIYLAGLSNGGTGVTRELQKNIHRYAGTILISPVVEAQIITEISAETPLLIIHGERDRRIPAQKVREVAKIFEGNGLEVTTRYYPGEDHFLFFTRRKEVTEDLRRWLSDE